MRKLIVVLLILAGSSQLYAQKYLTFDLAAFIAKHPTAASYDPITRNFTSSNILPAEIASLSMKITEINRQLADLAVLQRSNAAKLLDSSDSEAETDGWRRNQELGRQEKELKTLKYDLIARQQTLQQLSARDSGILPDISKLVTDIRECFSDNNAVYLNYLPAPDSLVRQKWLSSPLQIFLWSPQERHLNEYLDKAYAISLIFPQCRRPVIFQKSFERKQ
jgi:hypothetical protein